MYRNYGIVSSSSKNNIFDSLTKFFIILQIFGGLFGLFQPIRIFVFLSIPFIFLAFLNKKNISLYKYEFLLFVIWIIYGIISLTWALVPIEGVKELIILTFEFLSFFLLIFLTNRARNPCNSIISGWTILFILTIPIAFIEFIFDKHFPISYDSKSIIIYFGKIAITRSFASITYMNLNGYNALLCCILPFVLSNLLDKSVRSKVVIFWMIVFILSIIIMWNSSRATFICLVLSNIILIFYFIRYRIESIRSLTIIFLGVLVIVYYFLDIFRLLFLRVILEGLNDNVRTRIISTAYDALTDSNFLGVGAGNFVSVMGLTYKAPVTAPHNLFLEVGVQYGIFILILFLALFYKLYKRIINIESKKSKFIITVSLITFPLLAVIESSCLQSMHIWLYISSLFVIANQHVRHG